MLSVSPWRSDTVLVSFNPWVPLLARVGAPCEACGWRWSGWGSEILTAVWSLPQGLQAALFPLWAPSLLQPPCLADWHARPEVHSSGKDSAEAACCSVGSWRSDTVDPGEAGIRFHFLALSVIPPHVLSWRLLHLDLPSEPCAQTGGDLAVRSQRTGGSQVQGFPQKSC